MGLHNKRKNLKKKKQYLEGSCRERKSTLKAALLEILRNSIPLKFTFKVTISIHKKYTRSKVLVSVIQILALIICVYTHTLLIFPN